MASIYVDIELDEFSDRDIIDYVARRVYASPDFKAELRDAITKAGTPSLAVIAPNKWSDRIIDYLKPKLSTLGGIIDVEEKLGIS